MLALIATFAPTVLLIVLGGGGIARLERARTVLRAARDELAWARSGWQVDERCVDTLARAGAGTISDSGARGAVLLTAEHVPRLVASPTWTDAWRQAATRRTLPGVRFGPRLERAWTLLLATRLLDRLAPAGGPTNLSRLLHTWWWSLPVRRQVVAVAVQDAPVEVLLAARPVRVALDGQVLLATLPRVLARRLTATEIGRTTVPLARRWSTLPADELATAATLLLDAASDESGPDPHRCLRIARDLHLHRYATV